VFEQEEFRAHVTRQACPASGERMARELCVEHLLMPNGTMVGAKLAGRGPSARAVSSMA
jgi:hypothetical protein